MKPVLYNYQKQSLRRIDAFDGRALVALEPGLGKTIVSLYYAWGFLPDGPIVVVCPANVKWNWQREAWTHFKLESSILEGTKGDSVQEAHLQRNKNHLWIVNYDILGARRRHPRTKKAGKGWVNFLKALKPKLIIIDEC